MTGLIGKILGTGVAGLLAVCLLPASASAAPELESSTTEINFGSVEVGETEGPETFSITNSGDESSFFEIRLTGNEFEENDNCGGSLSPHENCEVDVYFFPQQAGPREAVIEVLGFGDEEVEVLLFGEGIGTAEAEINPSQHSFGELIAGEERDSETFFVESVGTGPLAPWAVEILGPGAEEFEIVRDNCLNETVEEETSCEIEVDFEPTNVGLQEATLFVGIDESDFSKEATAELSGVGASNAQIAVYPAEHDFGATTVGELGDSELFLVESTGTTPLEIEALSFLAGGENFQVVSDNCTGSTVSPGEFCEIEIEFVPLEVGELEGLLLIQSDAVSTEGEIALFGTGEANPQISVEPNGHDFGTVALGSSANESFVVENTGTTALNIGAVEVIGQVEDFEVGSEDCAGESLEPGGLCEIQVFFQPQEAGSAAATLQIFSDAPGGETSLPLSGAGEGAKTISVSPSEHDFGSAIVGAAESETFTATNIGTEPLSFGSAQLVNPGEENFKISTDFCSGETVQPGHNCKITVHFSPLEVGGVEATLKVLSDAENEAEVEVPLSGEGEANPIVSVEPATKEFGEVTTGSTVKETFAVKSEGTSQLEIGEVELIELGEYEPFAIELDTCASDSLAPGEECEIEVAFSPLEVGAFEAFLEIGSNDPSSPTDMPLKGTGKASLAITPAPLDFGTVEVGQEKYERVSVENVSSAPVTFTAGVIEGPGFEHFGIRENECAANGELGPGDTCEIEIAFVPTGTGEVEGEFHVDSTAGPSPTVTLKGTGSNPPKIQVEPPEWEFAPIAPGNSETKTFTVKNTGGEAAHMGIATVANSGSENFFPVSDGCESASLEPGETCEIEVEFEPQEGGELTGTLSIPSDAPGSPAEVELSGTGEAPEISVQPAEWDFGALAAGGGRATKAFVAENTGSTPLTISGPDIAGTDFEVTSNGCAGETLEPGETCEVEVKFEPLEIVSYEAHLTFASNAAGRPNFDVPLSGEGVANAVIEITPASGNFGTVTAGSAATEGFHVKNTGTTDLHVTEAEIGGTDASSFVVEIDGCEGATLPPGEECGVIVAFEPEEAGRFEAELEIVSDADSGASTAQLSGEGEESQPLVGEFSIQPEELDFGSVNVGTAAPNHAFVVENSGNTQEIPAAVDLGGADAGDFSVVTEDCVNDTLQPGDTCQVTVSFLPKAKGHRDATLTVGAEDTSQPAVAQLSGTGTEAEQSGGGGGGGGGGNNPPPSCPTVEVTKIANYKPGSGKGSPNAIGLRARLTTSIPTATVSVSAEVTFNAPNGKSRTAPLESRTMNISNGFANYKAAIPARLRTALPLGTPVTLKLTYSGKSPSADCPSFGPTQSRSLRMKVVRISV